METNKTMNKVRIWNREIDNCSICPYFKYDDYGCGNCVEIDLNFDTNLTKEIDKDCPFLQPITKEVIEGFGFRETSKFFYRFDEKYSVLYIPCNNSIVIWKIRHIIYKLRDDIKLFEGKLNNPQELEFILKSLHIIK